MLAYHNDPSLKAFLLDQLAMHRRLDHLAKGAYASNGKFCAIGCCLEALRVKNRKKGIDHTNHALLAAELAIPEPLLHLQDMLFEGLPDPDFLDWPQQFAEAITPGAHLSQVWPQFVVPLLTDPTGHIWPQTQDPQWAEQKAAIEAVADCYRRQATPQEFEAAGRAARAAVAAVWAAGRAARTARAAVAAGLAARAAELAARAAELAARAAVAAGWAAGRAARTAKLAARVAELAAPAYRWQRDLLLRLLRAAPMGQP